MERTGGDRLPTQVAVDAIVGKGLNPRDRRCLGAVDGCIGHDGNVRVYYGVRSTYLPFNMREVSSDGLSRYCGLD